jgi:ABC-2 type transport system permease protein
MAQSGVPGVTIMLLLAGAAGYIWLLQHMPAVFPFTLIGAAALTPIVCWSPLRTWLREADIVFLVPREAEMNVYLRRSFLYNGIAGVIAAAVVCLIFIPLYLHGPGQLAAPLLLAAVVLLKLLSSAAAWRERQLAWRGMRRGVRMLRWAVTAVGIAALLQTAPWLASLYLIAAAGLLALLYSRLQRYPLPWLTLIAEETRTRRRYAVFFSAFIDVPAESSQVAPRRYASWLAARIRYDKPNAFVYLYAYTLIRTELGGILLRLTVFGMFAGWLSAYSALWSGWGAAGVCLLFVWFVGVQLGSLAQSHRHSVWRHVYPLPDSSRLAALIRIDRAASLICGAALWLPHALLLPVRGAAAPAVVAAGLIAFYVLAIRPGRLKRSYRKALEEE